MAEPQTIPVLSVGVRLGQDPISGEPVLLYPEGFVILNPTAFEVVAHCDGIRTLEQILSSLQEEYDADAETLRHEVNACLLELLQLRVIEFRK